MFGDFAGCGCGLGYAGGCAIHGDAFGDLGAADLAKLEERYAKITGRRFYSRRRAAKILAKINALKAQGMSEGSAMIAAAVDDATAAGEAYLPPLQQDTSTPGTLPGGPLPWILGGTAVLGLLGYALTRK